MDDSDGKKDPAAVARGHARAAALSTAQRKAIAKAAAASRWKDHVKVAHATHAGTLTVGDYELDCVVLEDERRVISQRGVQRALRRPHSGQMFQRAREAGDNLPIYLSDPALKPFISEELLVVISQPIPYTHSKGGGLARGIEASSLPAICDVWLKARAAGALKGRAQLRTAMQAEILVRSLAGVGIVALVDEATGYQYDRARNALAEILEKFIRKELAAWVKTFPEDYYQHLFRLRKLNYDQFSSRRPPLVGKDTRDIVYRRLAPGVVEELEKLNPKLPAGHRRARHHQWLTEDVGHPKLREHLLKVTALMSAARDWDDFRRLLDRALPRYGDTLKLLGMD